MVDACYICRRTQADLDRLNEEARTRAYLSYFSNVRTQIEEQQRRIAFLQRLQDEESSDAHFRIAAQQVFGDPGAYQKLMPWIETLMEIADAEGGRTDVRGSIGELVVALLEKERARTARMEDGLSRLRGGFATGTHSPFALQAVTHAFPVDWPAEAEGFSWKASQASDREPLRRGGEGSKPTIEARLHICTACRALTAGP